MLSMTNVSVAFNIACINSIIQLLHMHWILVQFLLSNIHNQLIVHVKMAGLVCWWTAMWSVPVPKISPECSVKLVGINHHAVPRKHCVYISHVAQFSNTAQVTRQVSLLECIELEEGRKLVNTFLLHILY